MDLSIATGFHDDGGPIEPRLELIAEMGFTHVHWTEHWNRDFLYEDFYITGVEAALKRTGVRLLDLHNAETPNASPSAAEEDARWRGVRLLKNRIRFAAALGADAVVVHPGPFEVTDPQVFARRWEHLERSLSAVAPLCEEVRVKVALENMARPMPQIFRAILEKFSDEVVGFCFDSGHALIAQEPELIESFSDRLCALHLHDNDGVEDQHAMPGSGRVDFARIIRALNTCSYAKPLNFELIQRDAQGDPRAFLLVAQHKGCEIARVRQQAAPVK